MALKGSGFSQRFKLLEALALEAITGASGYAKVC